jgi:hypothetical protein
MAYYNEFFIEHPNGEVEHVASSTGSDSQGYLFGVTTLAGWNKGLAEIAEENSFWEHRYMWHPFPWDDYNVSDHLLVLRPTNKRWYEFWKPKYQVWIDDIEHRVKDRTKCYFVPFDDTYRFREDYDPIDISRGEVLQLPKLIRACKSIY